MSSILAPTVRGVFLLGLLTSFSFADSSVQRMQQAECKDDAGFFVRVNPNREEGCAWIDINPNDTAFRRSEQCNKKSIKDACPRSCGDCCGDNQIFSMALEDNGINLVVGCDWIGRSSTRIEKYCGLSDTTDEPIHMTCPYSCGKCPSTEAPVDPPVDAPVDPPVDPPVDAPIDPPVDPPVDAPVDAPIDPPVDAPVDAPIDPPVDAPVDPPDGNIPDAIPDDTTTPDDTPADNRSKGSPFAGLNEADDGDEGTPLEIILLPIVAFVLLTALILGAYVVHRKRQEKTVVELSETAQLDDTDEEMFRTLSVIPTEELNFPVKEETNYLPGLDCLCGPSQRHH